MQLRLWLVGVLVVTGACKKDQPPPVAVKQPQPAATSLLGPFHAVVPAAWTAQPLKSNMRAADWVLSATPGEEAELIVYYFGEDGAGSNDDNIDRWLGQFPQPGDKPARDVAKLESVKVASGFAITVSISGHYVAAMPGAEQVDKEAQSLLAAIVPSPKGPYYFKLVGASKTVDAHAAEFRALLASLTIP